MQRVTIERIAQGGDGVGHLEDGRVVFVPRGLPGDEVEIEVETSKKSWARGTISELVKPSPDRVASDCPHFDVCGGCAFRHMTYEAELRGKVDAARDTVERIGKITPPDGEVVPADPIDGYRVRARMHAEDDRVGYYDAGTNDVFDVKVCPVLDPRLAAALGDVTDLLRGIDGEVEIETAGADQILVTVTGKAPGKLVHALSELERVRGASVNGEIRGTYAVLGEEWLGTPDAPALPGGRFRQANGHMVGALRALAARRLGRGTRLVELFAGSGSLTFSAASMFTEVDAFENDRQAVVTGNATAKSLGHDHVVFERMDLHLAFPDLGAADVVLLDPPRTGAREACRRLGDLLPRRVVYVTCDIATFARDARGLVAAGYSLSSLDFVDMFPRTAHLEGVAVFDRD